MSHGKLLVEPVDEVSDQVVEAILKVLPNEKQRWFLVRFFIFNWLVLSDEQMSKRWPNFPLLNDEQIWATGWGLGTCQLKDCNRKSQFKLGKCGWYNFHTIVTVILCRRWIYGLCSFFGAFGKRRIAKSITLLPGPWMCLLSLPQVFEDSSIVYFGRSRHEMNPWTEKDHQMSG